ncbi:MAG TPA: LysR family transcriptional regulator [Polyangiales bacterium]|nr:LysR family transcriptional regulator [Polyangiales bacterium]
MTLEDLRTFTAVCAAGSLSAAASALNKSQPAVSQHVGRLEAELGIALLERRARGVVPTAAGTALCESALRALAELALARRTIEALRSGSTGALSIATGGTTLKHFMCGAIARFRAEHPEVAVRFTQGRSTLDCIEALRLGRVDLGFVTMQPEVHDIEQRPALLMDYALLVDARHELAKRTRVELTDLRGLELIGLPVSSSGFSSLRQGLAAHGIVPNTTTTVDDWDLCFVLVTLGLGSAVVPAFHAHEFVRQGAVAAVAIDGLEALAVGWVARKFSSLSPAASAFIELLAQDLRATDRPGVRVFDPAEHVQRPRATRRGNKQTKMHAG